MMNNNGMQLLKASEATQQAKLLSAQATLQVLLNNSVGIGEHTDLVADVLCFVEEISQANDNLEVVRSLIEHVRSNSKSLTDGEGLAGHI